MPELLEQNVRGFVSRGTSLESKDVIPCNDDNPRPRVPYASLLLVEDDRLGYPIRRSLPNELTRSLQHRRALFSLQFYRKGARDTALSFVTYAESENGLTDAEDYSFRVVFPLRYQRLDDIVGDAYEERALVNLGIDYLYVTDQDAGYIDGFEWTAYYGDLTVTNT